MSDIVIRVRLRKPVPGDVDARAARGISSGINGMYGSIGAVEAQLTHRQAAAWFKRLDGHPCAWAVEADDELVGEARLDSINDVDLRARLVIGLFTERHLGRGIGRRAIMLVLDHAFGPLGLHRVDLRVLSYNQRAIRCYEACGFVREGIERESARVGEAWHDDWIMGILAQDYIARRGDP